MKRAVVVFAIALLACSKSDSTPPPLSSDPTLPRSLAAGPTGDPCVDACAARFPGAVSTFEALDDCVVDSCQPIESSPSGGTCAAVGPGASRVSYGYAPTDACMATACCTQASACTGDPSCLGLSACMDTCNAR